MVYFSTCSKIHDTALWTEFNVDEYILGVFLDDTFIRSNFGIK